MAKISPILKSALDSNKKKKVPWENWLEKAKEDYSHGKNLCLVVPQSKDVEHTVKSFVDYLVKDGLDACDINNFSKNSKPSQNKILVVPANLLFTNELFSLINQVEKSSYDRIDSYLFLFPEQLGNSESSYVSVPVSGLKQSDEKEYKAKKMLILAFSKWSKENAISIEKEDDLGVRFFDSFSEKIKPQEKEHFLSVCKRVASAYKKGFLKFHQNEDYIVNDNKIMWASEKDKILSSYITQDSFVNAVVSAKHGVSPFQFLEKNERLSIHTSSFFDFFLSTQNAFFSSPIIEKKNDLFVPSFEFVDSATIQNHVIQAKYNHSKNGLTLLVSSKSSLSALREMPEDVSVMLHEEFLFLYPSNGCANVISIEMPSSKDVFDGLNKICKLHYLLKKSDGRLGPEEELHHASLVTRFLLNEKESLKKKIVDFWFHYWSKNTPSTFSFSSWVLSEKNKVACTLDTLRELRHGQTSSLPKEFYNFLSGLEVNFEELDLHKIKGFYLLFLHNKLSVKKEREMFSPFEDVWSVESKEPFENDFLFWRKVNERG